MRVTIIATDNRVNVEGFSESVDCSALVEEQIHVVQWYGNVGEIEYWNAPGATKIKGNVTIEDFSPYQKFYDAWVSEARKEIENVS